MCCVCDAADIAVAVATAVLENGDAGFARAPTSKTCGSSGTLSTAPTTALPTYASATAATPPTTTLRLFCVGWLRIRKGI